MNGAATKEILSEFADVLGEGRPEPQPVQDSTLVVREEIITPEYAAWLLEHRNRNPRKLRPAKAAQYATDMLNGNWEVGASVVAFDPDGWFVDGQHRAFACTQAGVPFRTLVARGVGQKAIDNADRGMKRAASDILKERGEVSVAILQAALTNLVKWDTHGPLTNIAPSWAQMEAYLKDNPDVRDAVRMALPLTKQPLAIRGSVVGPVIFRTQRVDRGATEEFIHKAVTGIGLTANDPILKLREVFLTRRVSAYGRPTRVHDAAIVIKAWNSFITGRPLRALKWNRGGTRQEPFPYVLGPDGRPWPFPDFQRDEARRNLARLVDDTLEEEERA
jgi:hypothetical protein